MDRLCISRALQYVSGGYPNPVREYVEIVENIGNQSYGITDYPKKSEHESIGALHCAGYQKVIYIFEGIQNLIVVGYHGSIWWDGEYGTHPKIYFNTGLSRSKRGEPYLIVKLI